MKREMPRPLLAAATSGTAALATLFAVPAQAGPADVGRAAFASCAACHATTPGTKKLGPSLFGVVGRKAGAVSGSNPSPALSKSGKVWTSAALDAFIAAPAKTIPGVRMPYPGMADAAKRKALVAYLATLK